MCFLLFFLLLLLLFRRRCGRFLVNITPSRLLLSLRDRRLRRLRRLRHHAWFSIRGTSCVDVMVVASIITITHRRRPRLHCRCHTIRRSASSSTRRRWSGSGRHRTRPHVCFLLSGTRCSRGDRLRRTRRRGLPERGLLRRLRAKHFRLLLLTILLLYLLFLLSLLYEILRVYRPSVVHNAINVFRRRRRRFYHRFLTIARAQRR